jgi:hypothetical protein
VLGARLDPPCAELGGEARRAGLTSVTVSAAPSALRRTASRLPTCPSPEIVIRRPATSGEPVTCSSVARNASYTPRLVGPAGSPDPPTASGRPTTCAVRSLTTSMSSVVDPTSSAVR